VALQKRYRCIAAAGRMTECRACRPIFMLISERGVVHFGFQLVPRVRIHHRVNPLPFDINII
jgi:hypothetical protein